MIKVLSILPKIHFCWGDWTLRRVSTLFWDFSSTSLFLKILSLNWFGKLWGNPYTKFLTLAINSHLTRWINYALRQNNKLSNYHGQGCGSQLGVNYEKLLSISSFTVKLSFNQWMKSGLKLQLFNERTLKTMRMRMDCEKANWIIGLDRFSKHPNCNNSQIWLWW